MPDVVEIAQNLIRCPSVTPKDEGAQVYLAELLSAAGFECHHLPFGEGAEKVPNLFARYGSEGPHLCYAGHTDVVPPGPEDKWQHGPFDPVIEDGILYGRGASDMKGSVAAFAAAAIAFVKNTGFKGSVSFLITGDEEGPAVNGTIKVLEWMQENNHLPDVAIVGEPTNPDHMGQEIKIGRRGSLTGELTIKGTQGHVAYQHLADNPLPRLVKILDALSSHSFDEGNEFFQPTNLEITRIKVNNAVDNVIPAEGFAAFNIRYNDIWTSETLTEKIHDIIGTVHNDYKLEINDSSQSFLTKPGSWSEIVKQAVTDVSGKTPSYTTSGGTSDARFIVKYCPVIECGGVNDTIHQINENTELSVLKDLEKVYHRILELYFTSD